LGKSVAVNQFQIGVWNPYTDHIVFKIKGYKQPLTQINVIEGTCQLISMDSAGIVKVRDIPKFQEY
jgi:hypothetical protein